jgi:hypothetical protein
MIIDLEAYFARQVKSTKKGTAARRKIEAMRDAYLRVWESFVEVESENEKLLPVLNAVSAMVRHVVEANYINPPIQCYGSADPNKPTPFRLDDV